MSDSIEKLHQKDRRNLERTLAELRNIHGQALVSVVLYGEAASSGYRPKGSPLTLAVVLEELTPAILHLMQPRIGAWRRRRIPTPLVMDRLYIESSLDVFPLEFLDITDEHLLLHGNNPFYELQFDKKHLRLEVEQQMRGKMLHLWENYLEAGRSKRTLRALLLATPPGFEVILRGMLFLTDQRRPDGPTAILAATESTFGLELPTFIRLEEVRRGKAKLARGSLEDTFETYLEEVRSLVRVADGL